MTKEFKVCHGDFNPSNVIVGDDGQSMCSTGHTHPGPLAADVATTYLLFALNSKDQAEAYLELSPRPCRHAHAGRASVDEHRRRFRARSKRNVNDEFLKNWIDVVDYQ